jgi:hypothetical protein
MKPIKIAGMKVSPIMLALLAVAGFYLWKSKKPAAAGQPPLFGPGY